MSSKRATNELRETLVVAEPIRRTMQGNRSKDTKPELALRKALWRAGIRGYRVHVRTAKGSPDIFFRRAKLAVFVHGCFWHGCPHCTSYRLPRTNAAFWKAKLEENMARDAKVEDQLKKEGLELAIVWECQIEKSLDDCVERIRALLASRLA